MTGDLPGLAPSVKTTLTDWHRFVETKDAALLPPLFADTTVFRSPFVHQPIPGRPASVLILSTVVQIFENFRYHRVFVSGAHDVVLEFSANIGDLQLKGVDLAKFGGDGKIVEFEVMVRPFKALAALGEQMNARVGPELAKLKSAAAR